MTTTNSEVHPSSLSETRRALANARHSAEVIRSRRRNVAIRSGVCCAACAGVLLLFLFRDAAVFASLLGAGCGYGAFRLWLILSPQQRELSHSLEQSETEAIQLGETVRKAEELTLSHEHAQEPPDQPKPPKSKRRILACLFGGALLVFSGIGLISFVVGLASGFRPWIGDGGQLVFHAGVAAVGWAMIDKRRRRVLILCGILVACGGFAVWRSFAERRFDIRQEGGEYVATYGSMIVRMPTNAANVELMQTMLSELSHRRMSDSLLRNKTLELVHYNSGMSLQQEFGGSGFVEVREKVHVRYGDTFFTSQFSMRGQSGRKPSIFELAQLQVCRGVVLALPSLAQGLCAGCKNKADWTTCKCCGVSYCSSCTDTSYLHAIK